MRDQVLVTERAGVTAPLIIPTEATTITTLLPNRNEVETRVGILTAVAASTLLATARHLRSKAWSRAPVALHQHLFQVQKQDGTQEKSPRRPQC